MSDENQEITSNTESPSGDIPVSDSNNESIATTTTTTTEQNNKETGQAQPPKEFITGDPDADVRADHQDESKYTDLDAFTKSGLNIPNLDQLIGKSDDKKQEDQDDKSKDLQEKEKNKVQEGQQDKNQDQKTQWPDGKRDLSNLTESEAQVCRNMSNEAFAFVKPILLEHKTNKDLITQQNHKIKELQAGKELFPDAYHEHPNAYLLSGEYGQLTSNVSLAAQVANHWKDQLIKVKSGEEWIDLVNDPKTGELRYGEKRTPDNNAEIEVLSQFNAAQNQLINFQNQTRNFSETFVSRHKETAQRYTDAAKQYFPIYDNKDHPGQKVLDAVKTKLVAEGVDKNNLIFELLARSAALNIEYRNFITANQKSNQAKAGVKNDQHKAGPTKASFSGSGESSGGTNRGGRKILSLDEMEKALK